MGPLLLRALLLLLLQRIALNYGSRYQTVGHENEKQFIQLKSQFDINPSSTLVLPIQVTPNPVGLNGLLPPRLVSINSFSSDGTYGPGDQLEIVLTFISNVWVLGNPTLTLNTGCHDDSCKVVEIQAFVCRADLGMFGLRLGDEFVMNINVNTTKEQFQNLLQQLPQIQNVSVAYSETSPSNLYSPVNRICTSKGNNVTLMFQNVSFPEVIFTFALYQRNIIGILRPFLLVYSLMEMCQLSSSM